MKKAVRSPWLVDCNVCLLLYGMQIPANTKAAKETITNEAGTLVCYDRLFEGNVKKQVENLVTRSGAASKVAQMQNSLKCNPKGSQSYFSQINHCNHTYLAYLYWNTT